MSLFSLWGKKHITVGDKRRFPEYVIIFTLWRCKWDFAAAALADSILVIFVPVFVEPVAGDALALLTINKLVYIPTTYVTEIKKESIKKKLDSIRYK